VAAAGICGCGTAAGAATIVAPIFAHGGGRGAVGCIVVSPPVFLSEEEALQVVREELAKAGIRLGEGLPLDGVTVEYEDPELRWMRSGDNWLGEPPAKVVQPAELAAVDRQQRVGVEVVTSKDCDRFRASGVWSTVSSYDTKGLAESVAEGIRTQATEDLRVGVFYDPMEAWSFDALEDTDEPRDYQREFEEVEQSAKARSLAKLRRQVRDFVDWLDENR
jgi:hypothetical protein